MLFYNGISNYQSQVPIMDNCSKYNELGSSNDYFNNFSDDNGPIINIFLYNYSQIPSYYPNYGCLQPALAPNSASYNLPYQIPQYLQQPNFMYCEQPFMPITQPDYESKKSKKNHKKHKEKKHKSKHSKKSKTSKKEKYLSFPYKEGLNLDGIINYLTSKTGGYICKNGTISIQGSSNQSTFDSSIKDARNLCNFSDLSRMSMWSSNGERNSNILFDFKDRKIKITDYTFHTPVEETSDYPRSWKIECSNDMLNWVMSDVRNDERSMNKNNTCNTFKCSNQQNDFYWYIKITSTGPCWTNSSRYYFDISAVEFFGFLKE